MPWPFWLKVTWLERTARRRGPMAAGAPVVASLPKVVCTRLPVSRRSARNMFRTCSKCGANLLPIWTSFGGKFFLAPHLLPVCFHSAFNLLPNLLPQSSALCFPNLLPYVPPSASPCGGTHSGGLPGGSQKRRWVKGATARAKLYPRIFMTTRRRSEQNTNAQVAWSVRASPDSFCFLCFP